MSENSENTGNSCITSSILSRSGPNTLSVVSEDYFTAATHLPGLAVLLLALRYKKLLSLFNGCASRPTTNYLYNFILPTNLRYPGRMRRERPIRPTQIASIMFRLSSTFHYQNNLFYFNK